MRVERNRRRGLGLRALGLVALLALPVVASSATKPKPSRSPVVALGSLVQLPGAAGCLVDRSRSGNGCTRVRALRGPAPLLGSNAVALSPDGTSLYVAAAASNAIAIFRRDGRTGMLTQAAGSAGCIAAGGGGGCATAVGLVRPNSLAVSSDGRNVYATAVTSDAVTVFRRDPATGALSQAADGSGCIAGGATPGCTTGRALDGPAVVVVSPDGRSAYVGSFTGNAVAVFGRSASSGALTQLPGVAGCIVEAPVDGCTTGLGLAGPEGMAVSPDGGNVYVASALSGTIGVFARDPASGALLQAAGGGGCIADVATAGCTTGKRLGGADAVALSADGGQVYVTSLSSQSLTTFSRAPGSGLLTQQAGTAACLIDVLAVGCSLGRSLAAPEGVAVAPDGAGVYVAAFGSGAVVILDRDSATGAVLQKPRLAGCVVTRPAPDCTHGRALLGAGALAISPDGRYVYAAGFASDAVTVFKRIARGDPELRRN